MKTTILMVLGVISGAICYEMFKHWRQERKIKNMAANIDRDLRKLEETEDDLHE